MRYRKGLIAISKARDIPMLLLIRDSRAISFSQLVEELLQDATETNSRSVYWRVNRLVNCGFVEKRTYQRIVGEPVYAITHDGLSLLEGNGYSLLALGSFTRTIVAGAEIPHMLELNAIRLSLKKSGLLVEWKNELQVISEIGRAHV